MAPPTEPPGDIGPLFADERARLLAFLATIRPDEWDRPTPCPGWSVLGLCTHLVGDDVSLLARQRDHHHGTTPPEGLSAAEFPAWLDELQVEWVHAARRLSPRFVTDLLGWTGPQLVELMAQRDPRARTADVSWAGPDPVPVWLDQLRELSEYWIHRQQLRQALGLPSELDPSLVGPILDGFRWAYPYRLAPLAATPGDTVTIEISGPVTVTWYLVARPAGWDFDIEPGGRVVATLSMTTEEAWRLLTNNLPPEERRALSRTGDGPTLDAVVATRAIIGDPR